MTTINDALVAAKNLVTLLEALNGGGITGETPPPVGTGDPRGKTRYPLNQMNLQDKMYVYKKIPDYRTDMAGVITGSAQLIPDILANNYLRQLTNLEVAQFINEMGGADITAQTIAFDISTYTGPLKQVYLNLVAAKKAGIR